MPKPGSESPELADVTDAAAKEASEATTSSPQSNAGSSANIVSPSSLQTTFREKRNWLIHKLFVRQEFDECLKAVDEQLSEDGDNSEFALYVKALVKRQQGHLEDSLQLFQRVASLNPFNLSNLKQVARTLFLLGKHSASLEVYNEAVKMEREDWEVWHNKGMCYKMMGEFDKSVKCFNKAKAIQHHTHTYVQLAKVFALKQNYPSAIETLTEGLEFAPENSDVMAQLGLLYLRQGDTKKAFKYLGNALTHDPRNSKAILASASVMQEHGSIDEALIKYRIAAVQDPNSGQLWNNIGMCFFEKKKFVAAIACLKRALFLLPFEWMIAYNLGLVHLITGQYASAFHFFSAAINLKPTFAMAFMYLAVTLTRLEDFDNAEASYKKAEELSPNEPLIFLNHAVALVNRNDLEMAVKMFRRFEQLYSQLDEDRRNQDADVVQQRLVLLARLGNPM